MYRIAISELGVANDDAVIEGPTPGDVWRLVQTHLKEQHKINLPNLEDVGSGGVLPLLPRFDNTPTLGGPAAGVPVVGGRIDDGNDMEARTIATRLIEKLHIGEQGSSGNDLVPPGGAQSPMP